MGFISQNGQLTLFKAVLSGLMPLALWGCNQDPQPAKASAPVPPARLSTAVAAAEPDLPDRQPGLWRTVITEEGSSEAPQTLSICIDKRTDLSLGILGHDLSGTRCEKTVSQTSVNQWDILAKCDMGSGGINEFSGTITGDYSREYALRVRMQTTGASFERMNRITTYNVTSKRIGDCREGQSGGDVEADGIGFNLFAIS